MTFNVEAFIKDATFPIVDDLGEYHDVMWPKDAHTLVTQLVPEGSAVVDKDTMASLIQCAIFVGSFAREPRDSRPVESLAVWARGYVDQLFANQSPLPASSGPEQTKDPNGGMPYAEFEKLVTDCAKDRAEPKAKCVCHYPFPVCAGPFLARVPDDSGKVVCHYCDHPRACHTPAPAAKEVTPQSE